MKINPNQQNNLETQLILDCSQTRLNSQQTARVSNVLSESPDWDFVLNIAAKNGLLPIICWNLLQKFSDLLDPEIKNLLSQTLQKQTKKNLFLTQQLIEAVKILEKIEIPILPFKGTTLAM
ncbi:MAG: nucleotidyltransferase family protein, partial [Acidobacteriota bacterium]